MRNNLLTTKGVAKNMKIISFILKAWKFQEFVCI